MINLNCDDELRTTLDAITPRFRLHRVLDEPRGTGYPRRLYKDEDGSFPKRVVTEADETFLLRTKKTDGVWAASLFTADGTQMLGRVDNVGWNQRLHGQAIQHLIDLHHHATRGT